jgi:raffinose/stachyose/melibiose transport system permease protein
VGIPFYLMVLPGLALFIVFIVIPLFVGVWTSLTNSRGFGEAEFVGLKNYVALFRDPNILKSYIFTFEFAIVSTLLVNAVSLFTAIGLNAKIKWRNQLRGLFFLPNVLALLIVSFVFNYILTVIVPKAAAQWHISWLETSILASPDFAWLGIVLVTVWQSAAFSMVIYLAGLQSIPDEVYEAAELDGAGPWRRFRSVTFPLIIGFFTINIVLSMTGFLQVFDQIVGLTNGGPGTSTQSISFIIYKDGLSGGEYAYQMANSVVYFIVIVVVSVVQLRYLQKREAVFE